MGGQCQIFDYDDILLLPRKCVVKSRSECDVGVTFGNHHFKLPVVPANMKAVVNEDICEKLARGGYFYIMHRFDVDTVKFAERMLRENLIASVSLGVKQHDYDVVDELAARDLVPQFITIDIAHGYSDTVKLMIEHIRAKMGQRTFIIAGNVATPEAVVALESWGADCTKIGVGPGKVCITRNKTGFGTGGWQLSAVKWCASIAQKPVIADGGIRHHGDIAKSLRFGARMVMCGSLFAGLEEGPGETVEVDHVLYKAYYGSASEHNKHERKNIEGKRILEPIKGTLDTLLKEITEDLQSSISYAGGKDLSVLDQCNYAIVGGMNEREHIFGDLP
ncbi:GMP reductase [Gregarina niphandrodes]|uniref:GMP reductase n=1 Tax=Gregarina niphandrodes TaxID=110365 RepID=A0A023B394_GRENI|nr:GMP reductase [Gregarina niphandrodes]EZG55164.1 GMP reductase [Gregarina niphandrodes]|eukprot:XP_011131752.1 GMP reductase [Gregarina niphandrodes]